MKDVTRIMAIGWAIVIWARVSSKKHNYFKFQVSQFHKTEHWKSETIDVEPPVAYNTPYYVFAWNLCGLVCIALWVLCTVGPMFMLFRICNMLRYDCLTCFTIINVTNQSDTWNGTKGHGYRETQRARLSERCPWPRVREWDQWADCKEYGHRHLTT